MKKLMILLLVISFALIISVTGLAKNIYVDIATGGTGGIYQIT